MATRRESLLDVGLLWLRVLMGAGIALHGAQKVLLAGGRMEDFTAGVTKLGLPYPEHAAWVAALSELIGGTFIALGLATRLAALLIFVTMSVAAFLAHGKDPYAAKELALAFWTMSGTLVLTGPGGLSLDALLLAKLRRGKPARRA